MNKRLSTSRQRAAIARILEIRDINYYKASDFTGDINSFIDCHNYLSKELENSIEGFKEVQLDALAGYYDNFDF